MKPAYHPLVQLIAARIRQFFREPEAIFWTYGFPLIMVVGLGIAFKNKPQDVMPVAAVEQAGTAEIVALLKDNHLFEVQMLPRDQALSLLSKNKTPVVLSSDDTGSLIYHFDPTNPDSRAVKSALDDAVQRAAGRVDVLQTREETFTAPGSRYIDFLVPGLIGMNLMGGGMWGIGFVLVDMRVRNLLKRLLATPMRRSHFLLSMVGARAMFFLPEMFFLIAAAYVLFGVPLKGSAVGLVLIALMGALCFAGLGLLTACRAQRMETVSGLMNLVMLPMWLMSGIFFSSERFPDILQPLIQALPLTQLINALRAVMLEGASVMSQGVPILILMIWGAISFTLALRWFRWS